MNYPKTTLSVFLCLLLSLATKAQIVNVESQRIVTDTIGWAGSFGGNFSLTQNVETIYSADAFAHIQFKTARNLFLLLGDYSFLKGADKKYIDNSFFHFRYNRKINKWLSGEFFTQLQTNKITKIDTRFLIGVGPRFKVFAQKKLIIYLGVSVMYEYEKELVTPPAYYRQARNSTYVSLTYKPNNTWQLTSTTFYQLLFNYFGDYRILNQETIAFKITKALSATLNWDYLYDQFPAEGVPQRNINFTAGFKYVLNP